MCKIPPLFTPPSLPASPPYPGKSVWPLTRPHLRNYRIRGGGIPAGYTKEIRGNYHAITALRSMTPLSNVTGFIIRHFRSLKTCVSAWKRGINTRFVPKMKTRACVRPRFNYGLICICPDLIIGQPRLYKMATNSDDRMWWCEWIWRGKTASKWDKKKLKINMTQRIFIGWTCGRVVVLKIHSTSHFQFFFFFFFSKTKIKGEKNWLQSSQVLQFKHVQYHNNAHGGTSEICRTRPVCSCSFSFKTGAS